MWASGPPAETRPGAESSNCVPIVSAPIEAPTAKARRPSTDRLALLLATAGGAGYAPVAPGTAGSALAVLLYLPLSALAPGLYAGVVLGLLIGGVWASGVAERLFASPDDGRIVIDEVVGQLLTLAPLLVLAPVGRMRSPLLLLGGFLLFRLLDIAKPGPIGWGERRFHGGLGVMIDDVIAGVLGGLVVALFLIGAVALGALS